MTDRIYAEDIARERGISVRAARDVLHGLPPSKLRREGRRLYTTRQALEASGDPEDRVDDVIDRFDALAESVRAFGDELQASQRDLAGALERIQLLERRVGA